jgi:hypothetical protein
MDPVNESILNDAFLYFPEIDRTADLYKREKDWLRPGSAPMFYPDFGDTSEKVLYVGMNPSITEQMESWFVGLHGSANMLDLEYFKISDSNAGKESMKRLIEFQAALKGKVELPGGARRIPYFTTLENFHVSAFGESSPDWEHFDIFNYRSTYQDHLRRTFSKSRIQSSEALKGFFVSSINRFTELVEKNNFRCIVVLNALVSRYLKENKVLGLDRLPNGTLGNIILAKQLTVGGTTKEERRDLIVQLKKF